MKSQVLLPKIFNFPFTYNSRIENKIGNLVEVPFGSKKEIGVIWKNNYTEPENVKIKYINKRTEYSIDRKLIDFIEWFSTYNMVPIGLVLKMAIGASDNFIKNKDSSLEIKKTKTRYYRLNDEQISALKFLEKVNNKFDVSVLQGTTGSGKTLVYFERIKKIIEKNQQVLVLLPEIFLTNEFKSRFEDFFGFEPSIWHSKITPKQKRMIWKGLIKNKDLPWEKRDHGLFIGYGPTTDPKYAVSVIVEHGGSGSGSAAPIASDVFKYLFEKKLNLKRNEIFNV